MRSPDILVVCASHAPGMDRDAEGMHGQHFRQALGRARAAVQEFAPDVAVLFGGDHRRVFRSVIPPFSVVRSASILAESPSIASGPVNVPTSLADRMASHLLASDFDVAVCRDVELDHAFSQPMRELLGDSSVPVLPLPVNCASPPLPTPERVLNFGRAVRHGLNTLLPGGRILVVGTGGLSHSPPSLETDRHDLSEDERRAIVHAGLERAREMVRPNWDRRFMAALEAWDTRLLTRMVYTATEQAGVGANEVRTWLAAAAVAGEGLECLAYEPVSEWITGMGVATSRATSGMTREQRTT